MKFSALLVRSIATLAIVPFCHGNDSLSTKDMKDVNPTGKMTNKRFLRGNINAQSSILPNGWNRLGDDINMDISQSGSQPSHGISISVSDDGLHAIVGSSCYSTGATDCTAKAHAYMYKKGTWSQIGEEIIGGAGGKWSEVTVDISGDGARVVIGAFSESDSSSDLSARVYEKKDGQWVQLGGDLEGLEECDFLGLHVAMAGDGESVVIGSSSKNKQSHAQVYKYETETEKWNQFGADMGNDSGRTSFGRIVDISRDGNRAVVAPRMNWGKGYAQVYENVEGEWTQLGGDLDGGHFGSGLFLISAALSGNGKRAIIGTYGTSDEKSSGHVHVYQLNNDGQWDQVGNEILLDMESEGEGDESGEVAISHDGSHVIVAAPSTKDANNGSGYVRIYEDVGGQWVHLGDDIYVADKYERFGTSVGMSRNGGRVIIGAQSAQADGLTSGHALVYNFGDMNSPCVGKFCEE